MRFPLTEQLRHEAAAYRLRSSCQHCAFYEPDSGRCKHGWPNELQRRWPLDAPDDSGNEPTDIGICTAFELR